MAPTLLKLTLVLAGMYAALVLAAFILQRRLEYVPDPSSPLAPRGEGLQEVELTAEDGVRLEAWYWKGERPLTYVVFHGNAGHRGDRLHWITRLRSTGAGVFILDYRGYGGSGGSPTEAGLYRDGEAALAWVRENVEGSLVYVGQSLGTGVAVEMAARHMPRALILQAASISAAATAQRAYPFLPVRLLMWDRYDCSERIAAVRCPVLFVHGEQDRIVPIALGRALFEAAREPKTWWAVPGAGHNDLTDVAGGDYLPRLEGFLGRCGVVR